MSPPVVRVCFRKWGDRAHWEYDAHIIGEDQHGTWLGAAAGTPLSRPGAAFVAPSPFVSLTPPAGGYVATFYGKHHESGRHDPVELYVDITTVPEWTEGAVTMVDLDLDVVRGRSGRVWVDDEDEFADHRIRFGYPDDVVAHAIQWCDRVQREVSEDAGPFTRELGRDWLRRLASVLA